MCVCVCVLIHAQDILTINTDFLKQVEGQINATFTHFVGSVGDDVLKIQMEGGMKRLTLDEAVSHSTGGRRILFNLPSRLLKKTMTDFRAAQCALGPDCSVA